MQVVRVADIITSSAANFTKIAIKLNKRSQDQQAEHTTKGSGIDSFILHSRLTFYVLSRTKLTQIVRSPVSTVPIAWLSPLLATPKGGSEERAEALVTL